MARDRSRAAVQARDREGRLDLHAEDAVVQDPFDPEGNGHREREGIAAITFEISTHRSNGAGRLAALRAFWEFAAFELVELEC